MFMSAGQLAICLRVLCVACVGISKCESWTALTSSTCAVAMLPKPIDTLNHFETLAQRPSLSLFRRRFFHKVVHRIYQYRNFHIDEFTLFFFSFHDFGRKSPTIFPANSIDTRHIVALQMPLINVRKWHSRKMNFLGIHRKLWNGLLESYENNGRTEKGHRCRQYA